MRPAERQRAPTTKKIEIASCVVDTEHCEVYYLQVMRTQLETLGEEFKLAGNI